jgi:hypothetical protein
MITKAKLRSITLNILLNNPHPPNQFIKLELEVASAVNNKLNRSPSNPGLWEEWLLFKEIFYDLLADKIITVGADHANSELPFFRLHSEARENLKRLEQAQK